MKTETPGTKTRLKIKVNSLDNKTDSGYQNDTSDRQTDCFETETDNVGDKTDILES